MLQGIRILDLSRLLPGGYCTRLLADLGADVVKVEEPGKGDPLRGLPAGDLYFQLLHAGKRGVTLSLKREPDRTAFKRLVAHADVLVEGFRPGVMERMGLGWADLQPVNPRLIYCAITGYGSGNSLSRHAGHDLNYLARSGVLSLMPLADGAPVIPGIQVADLAGAQAGVIAVLAALVERATSGTGRRVEVSMTEVMKGWAGLPAAAKRAGIAGIQLTGELPCYHVYAVKDGFLTVAALETRFWVEFCRAIGRVDLTSRQTDPLIVGDVAETLTARTTDEWMSIFAGKDVCVEPCLTITESPPPQPPGRAPRLGEHTREVLADAGLTPAEIEAL